MYIYTDPWLTAPVYADLRNYNIGTEPNQTPLQIRLKLTRTVSAKFARVFGPVEKPTPEIFPKIIKMIYGNTSPSIYKTRNCKKTVYHQSSKADLAGLRADSWLLLANITEAAEEFLFPWPDSSRCQTLWIHHQSPASSTPAVVNVAHRGINFQLKT